ncbi:hypothetical protein B0E41_17320 [Hydrogenophaga sp. A37]|nr:hypothetical protein B0E41_17320 [Hydrogenophaga sp. A37]
MDVTSTMEISLVLGWWAIPTVVSVLALLWAFFWPADDGGFMGGITRILMLLPALFVIAIAWVLAAIFK